MLCRVCSQTSTSRWRRRRDPSAYPAAARMGPSRNICGWECRASQWKSVLTALWSTQSSICKLTRCYPTKNTPQFCHPPTPNRMTMARKTVTCFDLLWEFNKTQGDWAQKYHVGEGHAPLEVHLFGKHFKCWVWKKQCLKRVLKRKEKCFQPHFLTKAV